MVNKKTCLADTNKKINYPHTAGAEEIKEAAIVCKHCGRDLEYTNTNET